jgi:hypothetical protein
MTTEENKDPFAEVRKALYKQKPENREAEIRAQKSRAKATAFLQAFGTIADAFTLHQGGDVVKRDLNPYVMNNMQRADAIAEQDRADKRAWENSWLNLENNIAQYGIRQQEIARQKAWRDEEQQKQREWQEKQMLLNNELGYDNYLKQLNAQYDFNEAAKQNDHIRKLELLNKQNEGKETVAAIRTTNRGRTTAGKPFISIIDPDNPSQMMDITESEANLLFSLALQDRKEDDNIRKLIPSKPNGKAYTRDEMKQAVELIAKKYPQKIKEYFGALRKSRTGTTAQTAPTSATTQTNIPTVIGENVNMPPPPARQSAPPAKNTEIFDFK